MAGRPSPPARPRARPSAPWRHPWFRHLRLPFNLLLSPIYLYGLLSGAAHAGEPTATGRAVAAWLSLHLFLYGGATAFNSYYDRDEGPVGGMLRPPAVDGGLLPFSLAVAAAGLVPALASGPAFTSLWLVLALLFVAYSHPVPRLKARPALALATVGLGQGAIGFALGFVVAAPASGLTSVRAVVGMAATVAVVTGLYLVTQSYQTAEDRSRGDRTLPVLMGPAVALRLAVAVLAVGGAVLVADLGRATGWGLAGPLAMLFVGVGALLLRWAGRFDEDDVEGNFRRAMGVAAAAGTVLTVALLAALLGVAPESPHPHLIP